MENELFEIPQSKSPKLLWMEKHFITIKLAYNHHSEEAYFKCYHGMTLMGKGKAEDEALFDAVKKLGIRTWNEETLTTQNNES